MKPEREVHRRIEITYSYSSDVKEIRDIHDCFDMAKVLHDPQVVEWVILWDSNPRIAPRERIFPGKAGERGV